MEKFLTRENLIIIVLVFYALIQSNYFATKLDLEKLRGEVLQQKIELQQYTDTHDKEILDRLESKYEKIMQELNKINKKI